MFWVFNPKPQADVCCIHILRQSLNSLNHRRARRSRNFLRCNEREVCNWWEQYAKRHFRWVLRANQFVFIADDKTKIEKLLSQQSLRFLRLWLHRISRSWLGETKYRKRARKREQIYDRMARMNRKKTEKKERKKETNGWSIQKRTQVCATVNMSRQCVGYLACVVGVFTCSTHAHPTHTSIPAHSGTHKCVMFDYGFVV